MTTIELQKTFKPKTGKNKHWFYRDKDTLTDSERKEADAYWELFLKEWKSAKNKNADSM